jgi:hypothetical protein
MVKTILDYINNVEKRKRKTNSEKEYTQHLQYTKNKSYSENKSQYDSARKEMGLSQDDNLTKSKYDSMFGNEKTGDTGMYGRYQKYHQSNNNNEKATPKKSSLSFDEKVDKGISKLGKFVNDIKDNKLANSYLKGVKKTSEVLYQLSGLKAKHDLTLKPGMKAMELEDKYVAAPTRNIVKRDGEFQPVQDVKDAWSGKKETTGEEVNKSYGIKTKSKYLNKGLGLISEGVIDPTNLIGAGVGGKVLKSASKLGKVAKSVEEVSKVAKVAEELKNTTKNVVKKPVNTDELVQKIDNSKELQNEINKINQEHVASYGNAVKEPTHMNIDAALDPVDAPLIEKPLPIGHDIPYKPGDPLPDVSKQVTSKTNQTIKEKIPSKASVIQQTIDNIHSFKEADKIAKEGIGRDLHADESMYKVGLNSRGSDMIAHTNINENLVNKHGDVVGDSLKTALKDLPKGKEKTFSDFLVLKHSVSRMKRGEKVYADNMEMNIPKARAMIRQMQNEHPEFQKLSKKFYNYQKNLERTWAVDTGLMSKEDYEAMTAANPFYVSNQRILPKSEKGKMNFSVNKSQYTNRNADVKKGVGSQLQIVDPIESTIERTDKLVKVAKQNEAMQVLAKNIEENPNAYEGFARIVPEKELDSSRISKLDIKNLDDLTDDFTEQFERTSKKSDGNIFYFMKDGKRQYMEMYDTDFIKAVANLEPHTRDIVTRNVGKVTNLFKVFVTGNPVFALTKNVWKDIPQAYANSYTTNNPLKFSKDVVSSFLDILTNSKHYKDFKAIGGGHSSSIAADRNLLKQSVRQVTNQKGIGSKLSGVKEKMEDFNNAIESAPRLAEYKRVMQEYNKLQKNPNAKTKVLKPGVSEYGAKQQGLYEANDITLNFKKHGNAAKTVDAYIPYLNASIQGLDKMARTFARNPVKYSGVTAAKAFTAVSLPTILLYAINRDNPKYQELSDHVKDNYMIIPNGKGDTFTKIPVPRELGPFFKAGVERSLRQVADNDPEAWKHYRDTIMTAFAPPIRSIFAPIGDVRANKDYNGAPIVPGNLANKSPRYQYDGKTSEPAKFLGNILNYSPKNIDYLGKSYTGVLGQLGQPATTESTTLKDWAKNQFGSDPTFSNDYQRDFYDLKTKIDQQYADYKAGDRKTPPNDALRKYLNKQNKAMSEERKVMRAVLVDKTLTREQRSKKVKELQEKINQLANLKNRK